MFRPRLRDPLAPRKDFGPKDCFCELLHGDTEQVARLFYLPRRLEPSLLAVPICVEFYITDVQDCGDDAEEVELFCGGEADYSEGVLHIG